ncbi:acetyl-CoA carboxylase biotin carboxylase subunit [Ammoniphilus sp. 3BR4]|uniref:acetyl-CoA carboxylase biotin carboxylase subunit n=1 Tax=Ammoniphilus sp. 3BR4 TaxID=3158265 RepID=UPI003466DFB1
MAISRIFIINRGEIAVRIIRTCKVLGIETVLAVSEADRNSLPARLADKTVCIGPASAAKSYLNIPVIITTALAVGADAVHPGYGFLSEVPELATACVENGLIYVGPQPEHIRKMGNKLVARSIAQECGVPVLPGSEKVSSYDEVIHTIEKIGLPVMLKAAAGGGGRGMKIVTEKENIKTVFESASAEAKAAFGDGTMYVEKYIANARHIEVQVLGDKYGNAIHLGERDCSTQRRHQKLIEEAMAPNVSEELRQEIRNAAVRLAENISYENAGTVEFIVDQDAGTFYFLEMNTRIQVEHPVTEAITGADLIQEQIHVANGEKLRFAQTDIRFSGHAIECRINAEAPEEGFRPTPGLITKWEMPQGPGVRVDTHCYQGYTVPVFYDSMIAKVIVHGHDRSHAINRMLVALEEFAVEGIRTTIPFLKEILKNEDFSSGRVHTRLLEKMMQEKVMQ